jgi:hypothetical protein
MDFSFRLGCTGSCDGSFVMSDVSSFGGTAVYGFVLPNLIDASVTIANGAVTAWWIRGQDDTVFSATYTISWIYD